MFQQPSLRVFQNPPTRTWSFKDPRVGYVGAALMLILSFLTSSRAANNLVEDGTKIMDAKKSQISTSSANRMVRISKGCSQKNPGGWGLDVARAMIFGVKLWDSNILLPSAL